MNKSKAKKTLLTFSLAAFLNDVGAHIIRPLWPAFITIILGAPVSFLGFIDGLGQTTAAVSRYPAGRWADTHKKKPFIWLGYLLAGLARLGYATSSFFAMLIPFHLLDRTGKGIREPARDALVAEAYGKEKRGGAFGFLEAMDHIGAVVGPLVGVALFALLSYRYTFAIAAIPSIIGAFVIWLIIKEAKQSKIEKTIKFKDYPKKFKILTATYGLFALSWFSLSFFILYAYKVGVPALLLPVFYLSFTIPAALACIPMGKLSDKIGRKPVMLLGFGLFSITCLGFIFVDNIWILALLFALYGIHYSVMLTVPKSFVSDIIPEEHRSSALGTFEMAFGIMVLPACLLAGFLWDFVSPMATFGYGFVISLISIAVFWLLVKK